MPRHAFVLAVVGSLAMGACASSPGPRAGAAGGHTGSVVGARDSGGARSMASAQNTLAPADTGLLTPGSPALRFADGEPPTNLLFLSIDTLRKDHVGAYGSDLTPFLDTLTPRALVLEDHVQCSNWTFGSVTCTLAGRSNLDIGYLPQLIHAPTDDDRVPDDTGLLAGFLADAGMYSILACGNSWLSSSRGNTEGYDEEHRVGGSLLDVAREGVGRLLDAQRRGDVTEGWFLHLHFMEPHAPYNVDASWVTGTETLEPWPEDLREISAHYGARYGWEDLTPEEQALLEAHLRALYAGEIRRMDDRLRTLWRRLEHQGLLDDTLVVIWSDHGEQFWEHGAQTHAFTVHSEENDAAAMFWAADILPGRFSETTWAGDLVPTLLDAWDLPIPPQVTGHVLGQAPTGRPIFTESMGRQGGQQAVVIDGLKLHYAWTGEVELYDRRNDPEEQDDLYDLDDPRVQALWDHLKPRVDRMAELAPDGVTPTWPQNLP